MRRRRLGRTQAAALLLTAATLALGSCGHEPHTQLVWPNPAGTTAFFAALHRVPQGTPYSLGVADVCVRGPWSVQVFDVSLLDARGQQLQAFALRPLPRAGDGSLGLGAEPGPLSQKGFTIAHGSVTVDVHCDDDGTSNVADRLWEVGVQVVRTADTTSHSKAVRIDYLAEQGRTGVLTIPFEITLCSPADHVTSGCR